MENKFLQFLGLTKKSGNLIEGYNKCEDILKKNKIFLVILSSDCSKNTVEKFIRYCDTYKVPYIQGYTKKELAVPLGRTEINILGITSQQMSSKLLKLWNEQKIRG
ncbi:ribosomal protein L7Ae [Clostridiales bacterium oral taxon 876 str. F0540]|nr:ribosomal protein L7Ae [Clostridiales bacterium oral taxon 876 str. F0540]